MSGFQLLRPKYLGHYVDAKPRAEERATQALDDYIAALRKQVAMMEQLRDGMGLVILELISAVREREYEDLELLGRLKEIEEMVKAL